MKRLELRKQITYDNNGREITTLYLKLGVLELTIPNLSKSEMFELIRFLMQSKDDTTQLPVEISSSCLSQDKRKKFFEIDENTFNPKEWPVDR